MVINEYTIRIGLVIIIIKDILSSNVHTHEFNAFCLEVRESISLLPKLATSLPLVVVGNNPT